VSYPVLSTAQIQQFATDGYLVVDDVVDAPGVELLLRLFAGDQALAARTSSNKNYDGKELVTPIAYAQQLTDDAYSAVARSRRLVDPLEQLFGDDVTHYYTLNMMKIPNTGGWQWHQDYGYHYKQFLYTDYISVMVALDPATSANGCLRVVKGSNGLGRLDHQTSGSQLIANPERVDFALQHLEEVRCELSPGAALYFHGNTLHASDANTSDRSRFSLIYSFVAASNVWVETESKSQCTLVDKLTDEEVAEVTRRHWERVQAAQ
jgi:phytanoyl-CoA hydroxylase